MPKKQFVSDLKPTDTVESFFIVAGKKLLDYRSKPGQFLSLTLRDRTGEVEGKVWDNAAEVANSLKEGDIVFVSGKVEIYREALQLNLRAVEVSDRSQVDVADFMPTTSKDIAEMKVRVQETVERIVNPHLHTLLTSFFGDEEFFDQFAAAPAAKRLHHACIGGLIEHVVNVLELCEPLLRIYPQVNRELLLTGILLHDAGKVRELCWSLATDYTDEGRLLGHILLGTEMVLEKIQSIPDFPEILKIRILHMILSHHGLLEYGSPKRPKTIEAQALHLIENLDAQLKGFIEAIEAVKDPDQRWTPFDKRFDRYLYTGRDDYADDARAASDNEANDALL